MNALLTGNEDVDAIANLHIEGNITPPSWYQHIKYTNLKGTFTDTLAIALLSDLVYWHRPSEIRDEATGHIVGRRKKFKGEYFQRNLEAYSNLFGVSYKQIISAANVLEATGVAYRFTDTAVNAKTKKIIGNVLYWGIHPDAIAKITYCLDAEVLKRSTKPKYKSPEKIAADEAKKLEKTLIKKSKKTDDTKLGHREKPETQFGIQAIPNLGCTYTEIMSTDKELINLDLKHKDKQAVGRSSAPTIALPDFLISNSENFPESDEEVKTQSSIPVKNSDTANPENEIKTPTPNPLPRAAKVRRIDRDVEMRIEIKVCKPPQATKVIFKENDFGWLQMPSTKAFKLARGVATRRLQNQLAPLFSNIKWSKNDRDELILVNVEDGIRIEPEAFSVSEWLDLASLRDELLEKEILLQDNFNELLEAIFIDSVKWCKKMGTIALKTIEPENAIANLFAQSDRNLLASIRGK